MAFQELKPGTKIRIAPSVWGKVRARFALGKWVPRKGVVKAWLPSFDAYWVETVAGDFYVIPEYVKEEKNGNAPKKTRG